MHLTMRAAVRDFSGSSSEGKLRIRSLVLHHAPCGLQSVPCPVGLAPLHIFNAAQIWHALPD